MTPPVDLNNCDREPIHIPGAIQPHGALLVLRPTDLTIVQVSSNIAQFCGASHETLLGQSLDTVIAPADFAHVRRALAHQQIKPTYLLTIHTASGQGPFDAIAHQVEGLVVLELEPARNETMHSAPELYRLIERSINQIRHVTTLSDMYSVCAREVRRIAGFDRVMVYRFDGDWNGTVIAEAKREDLEPFLGLNYPAADIPQQARELYKKNWLRFIADREYVPAQIVPATNPITGASLDMSFCVLRSVSPIHIEYLRNMGVGASMSVSLMKEGELWGLIACHHYSPRYVPYDIRTACELLGQIMSLELVGKQEQELSAYDQQMLNTRRTLVGRVRDMAELPQVLSHGEPNLLNLIAAQGAAVVFDDEVTRIGQTPGVEDVLRLSAKLMDNGIDEIFATDNLGMAMQWGTQTAIAAGVLAISLARDRRLHVMWFRPERLRTVNWAGDPTKSVTKGEEGVRLSPRGSFALWKQTVRGRSEPWTPAELRVAADFRRDLVSLLLRQTQELARQNRSLLAAGKEKEQLLERERSARANAEQLSRMKDEFVATLSHELRTPLNAILGWTQLMRRGVKSSQELAEILEIVERNARAQARMIEDLLDVSRITSGKLRLDVQPVSLPAVVVAAIETTRPAAEAKGVLIQHFLDPLNGVEISGDANRLQQVFWNLLSNAIKFTPRGGKVQVVLERVGSHVEISVSDTGQGIKPEFLPYVFERFRQQEAAANRSTGGLGLGLAIVRHLVELHGGTVQVQSEGEGKGATLTVSLPVRVVRRQRMEGEEHPTAAILSVECDRLDLQGVRVLVIDDEPDARALVARVLEECHAKPSQAGSAAEALSLLREKNFDVVVSDIGMPGEDGYAFIAALRAMEKLTNVPATPAIALTAYARPEDRRRIMLAGYQMHIAKPVEAAELTAVVANLSKRI